MKFNLVRIGFLFFIFGSATAGATIASDSVSWPGPIQSVNVPAKGQTAFTYYPIRRTVRVMVESSVDFRGRLHILDEARIKQWLEEDIFDPLVTVDVFGGLSMIFLPPMRGFYAFVVHNDLNETREVSFRFTQYGYEYDLLTVSGVSVMVGSAFFLLGMSMRVFARKKVKRVNWQFRHKTCEYILYENQKMEKVKNNLRITVFGRKYLMKKILSMVAFFTAATIAIAYLSPMAYAPVEEDEDYDVGETGSWTWAYISALWPPRYYNFHHDWLHDFAPGYWGPPPIIDTSPSEGNSSLVGWTRIEIEVWKDAKRIEIVFSRASLPPPD